MPMRAEILSWLRRRRERRQRTQQWARLLVEELGSEAYSEARLLQRRSMSAAERREWRDVALLVARMSGRGIGHGTAGRMAPDRDLGAVGPVRIVEPRKVDQIDELKRLIRDAR